MQLPDPLLGLLLEFLGGGGEVCILVAKQLVGDFAGEEHPQIRMLVDVFAHQIHTDGGPDGGNIEGAQQLHHMGQGFQHIVLGDDHLRVVGADVVRHLAGVLQVDGVQVHADGEGLDGLLGQPGRHGADQTGIQAAGEQEAHGGVRVQPLFDARHQLVVNVAAGGFQVVGAHPLDGCRIPVADEPAVLIVVAGREGQNSFAQAHQVLCLAGEQNGAVGIVAVVQRADADGIPGGNQLLAVIEDHGEFRVQLPEHLHPLLLIQGQQNLAVGIAPEGIALGHQCFLDGPEAVDFAVAHHGSIPPDKGLHACLRQTHNGQPVKAQKALVFTQGQHSGHIRAPGYRSVEPGADGFRRILFSYISDNGTHGVFLLFL